MNWGGQFVFGDCTAAYRGPAADNTPHAHAAIQVVLAHHDEATVVAADGDEIRGHAVLIRPLVEHSLASRGAVTLLYAEPQSPLAFMLVDLASQADICVIDATVLSPVLAAESLASWLIRVTRSADGRQPLDSRLAFALNWLALEPGSCLISDAALRSGLSESRLRALARDQIGVPLSTWLIWRKLERAARAMSEGESLAYAASVGGFADQAHLARAMRRMFGITPRTAQLSALDPGNRSIQD